MSKSPTSTAGTRTLRLIIGGILIAAAAGLFLRAWLPVLMGDRVLIGVDVLSACCLPWKAEHPMQAQNPLLGDPVLEVLPWQQAAADAFRQGRLPLWDPFALSGKPLLGGGLAGVFSPFNLLAVPFPAATGLSLGMLAKLWVAGVGMAVFLRLLGARAPATVIGGIAYATSSFMVVWLGWPHTGVTAIMPWAFAAAEWCLAGGGLRAQAALAATIALQFLAGHAETSLHLGLGLALYSAVRWAFGSRDFPALAGLAIGALVGTMAASAQLLPFIQSLQQSALVSDRATASFGLSHLTPTAMLTWLAPNAHGNPIYDGVSAGFAPNYNESTGFATVTMLTLIPVGIAWLWLRRSPQALALVVLGIVAAAAVYGPLTPFVGHLPLLAAAGTTRMIALLCFVVAALGGLGVEMVWVSVDAGSALFPSRLALGLGRMGGLGAGVAGLAGVAVAVYLLSRLGGPRVEQLWHPLPHGYLAFWVIAGGLALVSALGFIVAGLVGRAGNAAAAGLGLLVLGEAWLFAAHYQPKVMASDAGAPTVLTAWLQENARDAPFAVTDTEVMVPDSGTLYHLYDVRTYDAARSARARMFWSAADPGYHDETYFTWLVRPRIDWLALAGVKYVLTSEGAELPGTTPVLHADQVTVSEVPDYVPFARAVTSWSQAADPQQARAHLIANVSGPPVLEGAQSHSASANIQPAQVAVVSRQAGAVDLRVAAPAEQAVIIQQSWAPGWEASIDGHPATVHPANLDFQAVVVPSGEHEVSLYYQPVTVTLGLALSGLGIAMIVLLLTIGFIPSVLGTVRNWRAAPMNPKPAARGEREELDPLLTRDPASRQKSSTRGG
jgi:hypothetical protein